MAREGTSTSGRGRRLRSRCYDAAPMADLADRIRIRLMPALLTGARRHAARGRAAVADRSRRRRTRWPTPVADDRGRRSPTGRRSSRLPPLRQTRPPTASPTAPADRVATRVRIAALKIDLPVAAPTPKGYPMRRRDVPRGARPAGPGARDLSVRPRADGDVPAAARRPRSSRTARRCSAWSWRSGHERRPAVSCTTSPRSAGTFARGGLDEPPAATHERALAADVRGRRKGRIPGKTQVDRRADLAGGRRSSRRPPQGEAGGLRLSGSTSAGPLCAQPDTPRQAPLRRGDAPW